jgi:hypothetical protein
VHSFTILFKLDPPNQNTPQQLFQRQTIAELAAILDPSQAQPLAMLLEETDESVE